MEALFHTLAQLLAYVLAMWPIWTLALLPVAYALLDRRLRGPFARRAVPFGATVAAVAWSASAAAALAGQGAWALAIAPATATVLATIAGLAMHAVCDRGSRTAMRVANAAAFGLLVVCLLLWPYGGWYVAPTLLLLMVAADRVPSGAHRTPAAAS